MQLLVATTVGVYDNDNFLVDVARHFCICRRFGVAFSLRLRALEREVAVLKRSAHIAPVELSRPPLPHWNTESSDEEILDLIRRNQKIQAIKLYRERTGVGLKEAKDAIDALAIRIR